MRNFNLVVAFICLLVLVSTIIAAFLGSPSWQVAITSLLMGLYAFCNFIDAD